MEELNAQIKELKLEIETLKKNEKDVKIKRNYYQENKEVIKQKAREYKIQNKKVIQEQRKEPVVCICGVTVTKQHLTQHMMTKKHIKKMNII